MRSDSESVNLFNLGRLVNEVGFERAEALDLLARRGNRYGRGLYVEEHDVEMALATRRAIEGLVGGER